MALSRNLYKILEIEAGSSIEDVKSAYRRLAKKYHPDANKGDIDCIQKFKELTEAYEFLSDEVKKKAYDKLNAFDKPKEDKVHFKQAEDAYKSNKTEEKEPEFVDRTVGEEKNKKKTSNSFNDILESFTNSKKKASSPPPPKNKPRPENGTNVNTDVSISLEESLKGTERTVNILHTEKCPKCEGRKFLNGAKCPECRGLGEQSVYKKIKVKIPAGVKNGSKIRVANEGNRGYFGGKAGDLYLLIKIENNSKFKIDGNNLSLTVPISPFEAVLGADILIPSFDGNVNMKIVPNTRNGQKFRLAGQGLLDAITKKRGDMIVTVIIDLPTKLSEQEIELYKKLKKISTQNVREY